MLTNNNYTYNLLLHAKSKWIKFPLALLAVLLTTLLMPQKIYAFNYNEKFNYEINNSEIAKVTEHNKSKNNYLNLQELKQFINIIFALNGINNLEDNKHGIFGAGDTLQYQSMIYFGGNPLPIGNLGNTIGGDGYNNSSVTYTPCGYPLVFNGGTGDGYSNQKNLLRSITCSSPYSANYLGGTKDGYNEQLLNNITCSNFLVVVPGGIGDGFNSNSLISQNCFGNTIYHGGNPLSIGQVGSSIGGDGYNAVSITNYNCVNFFPSYGGNYDGYYYKSNFYNICLNLNLIYTGGNADGYKNSVINRVLCIPSVTMFIGGSYDGYSWGKLSVNVCPGTSAFSSVYSGAIGDGYKTSGLNMVTCVSALPMAWCYWRRLLQK